MVRGEAHKTSTTLARGCWGIVFGQLQPSFRSNYETLVAELNSRFRVVETKKTLKHGLAKETRR